MRVRLMEPEGSAGRRRHRRARRDAIQLIGFGVRGWVRGMGLGVVFGVGLGLEIWRVAWFT